MSCNRLIVGKRSLGRLLASARALTLGIVSVLRTSFAFLFTLFISFGVAVQASA